MLKIAFGIFLTVCSIQSYCQNFLLPNEEIIISFDTENGKHLTLAKDKSNNYIIYRFGSKEKVEFEFPEKNKNSWSKFKYSYYLRGGGAQNEAEDLNYIYFINKNVKYTIYDTYRSIGNSKKIGVKVSNTKTNRTTDIKGTSLSRKGSMTDFRDNGLLEIIDLDE